ncbi:MAG: head maturation protease, ClpP-related [Burkholderiaceae bacterium]
MFSTYFGDRYLARRRQAPPESGKFWNVTRKGSTAEVAIFDEIGFWGTTAADFRNEIRALDVERITLRLNSPGGDVFDGIAIHNLLKQHPAAIDVVVDGIAASAASFVAMAGDTVKMSRHSMMMVHEAWGFAMGPAADMRKAADMLERLTNEIAEMYAERSGTDSAIWLTRMAAETWFSDQEAVDAGLADEVLGVEAAKNAFDLSMFRHPPRVDAPPPAATRAEDALPSEPDWKLAARFALATADLEVA